MKHEHKTITEFVDPVCGMPISREDATGTVEYKGTLYYFCNPSCEEKFRAMPEDYVGDRRPMKPTGPADVEHTCPMDPEVRQIGPGSCPKCGMAFGARNRRAAADPH